MSTILIILYLIGYLSAYVIIKIKMRDPEDNGWGDVFFTAIMSSTSWLGIIMVILSSTKPPKWL